MIEVKEIKTYAKRIPVNVIEPEWKRYIELPLEQSTLKKTNFSARKNRRFPSHLFLAVI